MSVWARQERTRMWTVVGAILMLPLWSISEDSLASLRGWKELSLAGVRMSAPVGLRNGGVATSDPPGGAFVSNDLLLVYAFGPGVQSAIYFQGPSDTETEIWRIDGRAANVRFYLDRAGSIYGYREHPYVAIVQFVNLTPDGDALMIRVHARKQSGHDIARRMFRSILFGTRSSTTLRSGNAPN